MAATSQSCMLRSIFYARFHSERGPVVLRQHPRQSIFTSQRSTSHDDAGLLHFNDVSPYIIPQYELCNNALAITCQNHCILGWPVSIEDSKYPRNRFTFNVCFVLDERATVEEKGAWTQLVRKTARWFKGIEESDGLLSAMNEDIDRLQPARQDGDLDVMSKVLEQAFIQLRDYEECCIPISAVHVLNLRLDVREPSQAVSVNAWDVPLITAELPDQARNLVLQQIHPHVNGINHMQRVSELADVELQLVQSTVRSMVSAGLAILLDIFHSQAIYTSTADMGWFIKDDSLLTECRHYISREDSPQPISIDEMIDLYLSLQLGRTVADFCLANRALLSSIDVRRMITFGVIKGFLRRVHRYAQASEPMSVQETASDRQHDATKDFDKAWKLPALSSGWATPPAQMPGAKAEPPKTEAQVKLEQDEKLRQYLDGQHCLDQACVEMRMTERTLVERLSSDTFEDVVFFTR